MLLRGSCHCKSVRFTVNAPHPYPFNQCYCSICRKTAGGGGYAINLGAEFETLRVEGEAYVSVYQALIGGDKVSENNAHKTLSPAKRHFCSECGSALWQWDPRWPALVHPFASAIDSELPTPPERTHMMLSSKATWVEVQNNPSDKLFETYPDESLAQWHQRHNLEG